MSKLSLIFHMYFQQIMIFTTCLLAIASVFIIQLSDAISPIAELHLYEQRNERLSELQSLEVV